MLPNVASGSGSSMSVTRISNRSGLSYSAIAPPWDSARPYFPWPCDSNRADGVARAPGGGERRLLEVAAELQEARRWHEWRPPLPCRSAGRPVLNVHDEPAIGDGRQA